MSRQGKLLNLAIELLFSFTYEMETVELYGIAQFHIRLITNYVLIVKGLSDGGLRRSVLLAEIGNFQRHAWTLKGCPETTLSYPDIKLDAVSISQVFYMIRKSIRALKAHSTLIQNMQ